MHVLLKTTCLVLILTTLFTSVGYCGQAEVVEEQHPAVSDPDTLPTGYNALLGVLLNSEVEVKTFRSKKIKGILLFADSTSIFLLSQQKDTTRIPIDEIQEIEKFNRNPIGKIIMFGIVIPFVVVGTILGLKYGDRAN